MEDGLDKTRKEYVKRINYILDFIEMNFDKDLSLASLAQKANYSPFHFHRIFSIVINEPLNQYVVRKRVERIASILITDSKTPIKKLSYDYGFNSESSFSRAFKKFYGISPMRFRSEGKAKLSKIGIESSSIEKYICSIDNINKWIKMNSKIVITKLQDIQLAGITHIGEFDKMESYFQRLMKWGHKKEVLNTLNFKAITIYHDNPNVTQITKVRFSACITVRKEIKEDKEIRPLKIYKGIYVVARFEIDPPEMSKAWKNICIWIMENGYEFRDGQYFEIYHNDHKTHPEQKIILDICIPIEKTDNIKFDKTTDLNLSKITKQCTHNRLDYHELVKYMKELKAFFNKEYETHFKLGTLNTVSPDYTYLSLTTEELKKQKLKFVIILDHQKYCFTICLSGQNKAIRKKYWEMFKGSDWDQYHIAESITNSLMIIDHTLVQNPNFDNRNILTEQIETEALKFMNELTKVLEDSH